MQPEDIPEIIKTNISKSLNIKILSLSEKYHITNKDIMDELLNTFSSLMTQHYSELNIQEPKRFTQNQLYEILSYREYDLNEFYDMLWCTFFERMRDVYENIPVIGFIIYSSEIVSDIKSLKEIGISEDNIIIDYSPFYRNDESSLAYNMLLSKIDRTKSKNVCVCGIIELDTILNIGCFTSFDGVNGVKIHMIHEELDFYNMYRGDSEHSIDCKSMILNTYLSVRNMRVSRDAMIQNVKNNLTSRL